MTFSYILSHLYDIMVRGTPRVYFLELTNIILVVSKENLVQVEAFSRGEGLAIVIGSRYLVCYIGYISP